MHTLNVIGEMVTRVTIYLTSLMASEATQVCVGGHNFILSSTRAS